MYSTVVTWKLHCVQRRLEYVQRTKRGYKTQQFDCFTENYEFMTSSDFVLL